jgi:hypothetical protein
MSSQSSTINTTNYSLTTLEDTPRRALEFLRGVGSSAVIMRIMGQAGYTSEVHQEGLRLLANVASFVEKPGGFQSSASQQSAVNEIDAWYKTVFRRVRAAVTRLFPEKAEALYANLDLSLDLDATLAVKIFLDRLGAIEAEGKGKNSSGHALHKMLVARGFGPKEVHHLRTLIEAAQEVVTADDPGEEETAAKREARLGTLRELRAWFDDWSETARTVLVRRDHAIRVGLAHRKTRAARTVVTPAPAPVVATPASPVAANDTKAA